MCPAEDLRKERCRTPPAEAAGLRRGLSDNYYRLKGLPNGRRIHAAVLKDMPSGDAAAIQAFERRGIPI